MAIPTSPPSTEQGSARIGGSLPPWSVLGGAQETDEYVAELMFPNNVATYRRMGTDAQVRGLKRAVELPVRRYRWFLDPNGADEQSVRELADDLDLPIKGEKPGPRRRRQNRFSYSRHLPDSLRSLWYGFYGFELTGEVVDGKWRLRKMAPRPPRIVTEILSERDGSLAGLVVPPGNASASNIMTTVTLKPHQLLLYSWDMEAGNWYGESMLRSLYRPWIRKDRLLRVDVTKHERQGMGVPVAEAPPGATRDQIEALDTLMRATKVTEHGGMAVPSGTKTKLMGVEGSVPDTIASIRFDNEEMATAFLAMFKELGQTAHGSRALGEVQYNFFDLGVQSIAQWLADVFTEYFIERWYDWNYGEDSQHAVLAFDAGDSNLAVADLVELIKAGAIKVDDELEQEIREQYGLPDKPDEPAAPTPPVPTQPPPGVEPQAKGRRTPPVAAAGDESPSLPMPDRELRRQPYDHEVLAAVDYAALDAGIAGNIDQVVEEVQVLQQAQINELHDLIVDADGDVAKLGNLRATPVAEDTILAGMQQAADMGIDTAVGEAERQGKKTVKVPGLSDVEDLLVGRAKATSELLTSSISQAASAQAVRLTGAEPPAAVAATVKGYLNQLQGQYLKDQLGGAMNQAMNTGRKAVMGRNNPQRIYASELLDTNTCGPCMDVDGTEYATVGAAEIDYPTGGYSECDGMERCRGTLVAVYEEAGDGNAQ